ncbi:MAG: hypothetical protein MJ168_11835 [Clostridia bacterium]|nr:hypothetical protein [Clostridia bacterium]
MSNAKRFLSVILAIIMVCSTLVIGANAAYTAYKDAAIKNQYNALDTAVLTTDQYASAAMDEVDRMLDEEQLKFTRDDIFVGDVDLTSIDNTMDSVYALVNGTLFSSLSGMLGDLKNLSVEAFKPEAQGGVRRGTSGKTDTDIIYAVLQFLYNNKGIFVSFVNGTIDLGSILPSLVDISEYTNVNKLLKGLLYEATYVDENGDSLDAPDNVDTISIDTMVQDLIDRFVIDEFEIDGRKIGNYFEGDTNISTGSMYQFLDKAIKDCFNAILVPILNSDAKRGIGELCGIEYTKNEDGTYTEDRSGLNAYASLLNVDYTISEYNFTSATVVSQLNNIVKAIADQLVNPAIFVWQGGANSNFKQNVVNLAKAALVNTGDDFFASYIDVASPEEVEAMTAEELTAYALRAIINGSVDGMYIPEEATTLREFGYYALTELLATSVPELDFSSLDKNSTDSLIIMGIDFAIYNVSANLDMGLNYVYDMDGVDAQLKKAAQYGIDNYGGLFSGISFTASDNGWSTVEKILFRIINQNWLPAAANGHFKNFLIDCLIDNILDLDFDSLFALFDYRSDSELQQTPKKVVINRVASIFNTIFPGAINGNATTLEQLATNSALAGTVDALFSTLYNERVDLVKSILPTVCSILDLTNRQEFEFPKLTYDKMIISENGIFDFNIKIRNSSTGINTAWTDANGKTTQDALYTYDIKSITSSISTISVASYPSTIAGGVTENIRLNGSVGASGVLKVTIKYDVLTEKGTTLTSAPIEEDVYIYLAKAKPDATTFEVTNAVNGMVITEGPKNVYAKSMGDITDITLSIANTATSKKSVVPTSNIFTTSKNPKDKDGNFWFELNTEPTEILQMVDNNPGIGRVTVFKTTDAYKALNGEEKKAKWDSMIEQMTAYNARTGAVSSYPKTMSYTIGIQGGPTYAAANLFVYNDYNLGSLVNSELTKHRQASAYSSASAWSAYQTALTNAVKAVYSPFDSATFASATGKAAQYESASAALTSAIEALEETAQGAGVESLQAIIDQYNPSNEGLEYDDPNYNYFAVADYVDYTYYNYRDEYKSAQKMINKATIPDEETGEVAVINELDKAYMEHRLSLYGERLLQRTPVKTHLAAELNNLTRTNVYTEDWSDESWANFERAYAFATSVNNTAESALKQSKINRAYEELLEAEKRLVKGGSEEPSEAYFELVDPSGAGELTAFDGEDGTVVLTGITMGTDFEPEDYFNLTNCTAEIEYNAKDNFSTGAVVTITDDNTGDVLATYVIAVYADVDGDNDITAMDITQTTGLYSGTIEAGDAVKTAADLVVDNNIDAMDITKLVGVFSGTLTPDFVNRETH